MNKRPYGYWRDRNNRIKETIRLVETLRKEPGNVTNSDFNKNRLAELVKKAGGTRNALMEAGYAVSPNNSRRRGYWKDRSNRVHAIKDLVQSLNKPANEVTQSDFFTNGLSQLMSYYNSSPWSALKDAGFNYEPWEMKNNPIKIWRSKDNRIRAVKWLVEKLKKPTDEIVYSDFVKHGFMNILLITKGVANALNEAGIKTERRFAPRNHWKNRTNRINAIQALVNKLNKEPGGVTYDDFCQNGIYQVLQYYNGSAISALQDAGYDLSPEIIKQRMMINGKKIYESNHGHLFRSIFERDLDDWLYLHGVRDHEHDVPYPDSRMSCDIVVGEFWIEATGMMGRKSYSKRIERKIRVAGKFKLKLIVISYDDFYRPGVVECKLADVLRDHGSIYNQRLDCFL
jgi:hypothetical protein